MSLPAQLSVEVLKELRDHTRGFLKLDIGYIAAVGALITALKIGRSELLEFGSDILPIAILLSILAAFDVIVAMRVHNAWFSAASNMTHSESSRSLKLLLNFQPVIHFVFIIGILMSGVIFADGSQYAKNQIEGRVLLQEQVELFILRTGKSPKSIAELQPNTDKMQGILRKLDGEGVHIEATGPKSYKLAFAGWDKEFGTSDDEVVTQDYQIRKTYERVFGSDHIGN